MEHDHSQTTERLRSVKEMIHPEHLPEVGFQSYEVLTNDASALKAAFLADEMRNPHLQYPKLHDDNDRDKGIANLYDAIKRVKQTEIDKEKADIIATSLEFRAAEMEYVKRLGRLDVAVNGGDSEEAIRKLMYQARDLGDQLYGKPDETIRGAAYSELWSQFDRKQLSSSARQLYDDLNDGFSWGGNRIAPLPRPEVAEKLPDFTHPSLAWAGEIILQKNADIEAFFREWWDDKVAEYGKDYVAKPKDIAEAYRHAFLCMDPENKEGIGVILDPHATALSWESSLMAVKVGEKRAPITSPDVLFRKFLHEGIGHGGRAMNGLKSDLPILGTGLYTDTPRADYLTFEEGFCTTIEETVSDTTPQWNGAKLGHYINISRAAAGADFRSTFETAWRYRLLATLDNNQEVTDEMISKEKNKAYTAVVRIFRGTPTDITERYPGIKPLTFNKDLAYLNGRVLAMNYIKQLYEQDDKAGLVKLFCAKYDPTIPEQAAIVEKYGV